MSRCRAPTASRRPISRVRSVTDTSMMFMMPMPPTASDTPATAASSRASVRAFASCAAAHVGEVADREVVVLRRLQTVTLAQQRLHFAFRRSEVLALAHFEIERVDRARNWPSCGRSPAGAPC